MPPERIGKVLAAAGVASRRGADALVEAGRVTIDGRPAVLGEKVEPGRHVIAVDGRSIAATAAALVHLAIHKPAGVTSTAADRHATRTVLDLVPPALVPRGTRLYPVGRLDQDSEGLLLLTNDGAWTDRVLHPRHGVEREYAVALAAPLDAAQRAALAAGIELAEGLARLVGLRPATRTETALLGSLVDPRPAPGLTWYRVVLAHGWKRQVRRMLAAVGAPVVRLVRVRVGTLRLDLPAGGARLLSPAEVRRLGAAPASRPPATFRRAVGRTAEGPADLLFTNGAIGIVEPTRRVASAVAVRDGRILAIGQDADLHRLAGPATRVVDLEGRSLLPGFQDAHVHPPIGGWAMLTCDLHDVAWSRAAYLERIRAYADARPDEPWIVGSGWSMPAFPGGTPSRLDLDVIVPDRPVYLENRDAHGAWVNSRALALAGLTAASVDPPDGRIERNPDGSPQGTLHEGAANLVRRLVPPFDTGRWEAALLAAQAHLHALGITAITDAWVAPEHLPAYRALAERGVLTLRTNLSLWWERGGDLRQLEWFEEARRTATVGRLRASAVKLMLDGVLENYTGALLEPYLDASGRETANSGIDFIDRRRLADEFAPALDAAGFQLHFHAIGDRAVRSALDAVEATRRRPTGRPIGGRTSPISRSCSRMTSHASRPSAWARTCSRCGLPSAPRCTISRSRTWAPGGASWQYPFRSLERAGARLVGGSDWPISTANVLREVEVAVNRVDPEHRGEEPPFLPAERLDLASALTAFTAGAAWANGLERETGSLEPGKLADLVVLDRDVFDRGAGEIGDAQVLLTLSAGVAVHADAGLGW